VEVLNFLVMSSKVRWDFVCRLALLSDAASLATKLETKMADIESWLNDIDAENSRVCVDDDAYSDPEKCRLERQSVTVRTQLCPFLLLLCHSMLVCNYFKWLKDVYGFSCAPISELWSVTCHIGSHSVTCHPTLENSPCLNPSQAGR